MSVVTEFEEAGPWRKRLTIEVPAPAVDAEAGRVAKEISRDVAIPGFRKGKVPASLIRKRFAAEVEHRVAERLVPRYLRQAEAEKSLDPLTQPEVEDVRFEAGAPMVFIATVEIRPEIELRNIVDFTLPELATEPSEDEIEQALTDLRRRHRSWKEVDRPSATGDLVQGEVSEMAAAEEASEEGGERETQPLRVELGASGADEELSLALTGMKAGQSTTFKRPAGEGSGEEEREYRLEVTSVEEEELPELDDDFADKVGAGTVENLRDDVKEQLASYKKMEAEQSRERALLEQLRERHPLELPEGVVSQEAERMMQEQASRLQAQGVNLETTPIDWQSMAAQFRPEAEKRVHNSLLLNAIAKAKELKVDEAEFERVLTSIARDQRKSSLAVRQELDASGRLGLLRADLLERQALRHLLGDEEGSENDDAGSDVENSADEISAEKDSDGD